MTGLPAHLPDAARAYLASFSPGRIEAFPITALDRTGVPVWIVALFLDDALGLTGAMPSGIGYGDTDEQAILGALGEIAEAIHPTLALQRAPKTTATWNELAAAGTPAADPLTLGLPAGSPVDRNTPLDWVAATRTRDGETVLVPIDIAACDWFELSPGYQPFTALITNGLGAGPDLDWAINHGLLEILQRDGNGLVFRALDQGVALTGCADHPALRRLNEQGITAIPKFATDEFGLTNLYVVGHEPHPAAPIMLSACGEACHPDPATALAKAATEYAAARARKAFSHGPGALVTKVAPPGYAARFVAKAETSLTGGEPRALDAMLAWATLDAAQLAAALAPVYTIQSEKPFATLPTPDARTPRQRVEAAGFDILVVDCSPPNRAVATVKVIVPGLEVETMSYHRIGARNTRRLIARDHPLIGFGPPTATRLPVRMPPEEAEALGHPLFDTALADAIVGPLYPLYREPEAHHVAWVRGELA